jgi:OOP family OmpA-OmpF porin
MTRFVAKAWVIVCCGLLAGCAGMAIRDVGNLKQQGSTFDRALYDGYLDLAKAQDGVLDFADAHFYAERARSAAAGQLVEPDSLDAHDLPNSSRGELTEARGKLVAALDGGARDDNPQEAAQAQVSFDCWLRAAADEDDTSAKPCRGNFFAALTVLQAEEKAEAEAPPGPYYVMFDFDSVLLDDKEVTLPGHTDLSGSKGYNAALAERRAESVALYMTDNGAMARDIVVKAMGEDAPAMPTADGEQAALNRRVEIVLE